MFIEIVLLGGARRVTFAEMLRSEIQSLGIICKFFSIEKDSNFYPISSLSEVVAAPTFGSEDFVQFLIDFSSNLRNPLFICCMDAAIPAIVHFKGATCRSNIVTPTLHGANIALNKGKTDEFFSQFGIKAPVRVVPNNRHKHDKIIAKPLQGFGGKGITVFEKSDHISHDFFETHILQEFIGGVETTHDVYFKKDGTFISSSRDRLTVIDGEVDHCIVRGSNEDEQEIFLKVSQSGQFFGPVTIQTIKRENEIFTIEINARFGGGVTASLAAGYGGIRELLSETFGVEYASQPFRPLEMKRARRDFYRFI